MAVQQYVNNRHSKGSWRIAVDTGGTFTDCIAISPAGDVHRCKVLSSSSLRGVIKQQIDVRTLAVHQQWSAPDHFVSGLPLSMLETPSDVRTVRSFDASNSVLTLDEDLPPGSVGAAFEIQSKEEAPVLAARLVTRTLPVDELPPMFMRLATTRGTNALLERRGARSALFVTKGFRDLLRIGDQRRSDLFALDIHKPPQLVEQVVEVHERLDAQGRVLLPIDTGALRREATILYESGVRCAAVALLHSYLNPLHEQIVSELLRDIGFTHVSRSSNISPVIRILPRAQTCVVDAYLSPVMTDYLRGVQKSINAGRLHVMASAGGLTDAMHFSAKDSLLSGPAGGVVGAAAAGRAAGYERIIGLDMGGTSTDVARFDGAFDYRFEHSVGDATLLAPALTIETVAAGGGSICSFVDNELRVGPESAGALPGPACYGAGGPMTLTDVNMLLGRLNPIQFQIPIVPDAARRALNGILDNIESHKGERPSDTHVLEAFLELANQRMADAIGLVSVRKGYDPSDYALVAFGGAAGQHACSIARRLNMRIIVFPPDASLLSAVGLQHAAIERFATRQILQPLDACLLKLPALFDSVSEDARQSLLKEGLDLNEHLTHRRLIFLRLIGQDETIELDFDDSQPSVSAAFLDRFTQLYGYTPGNAAIEVESIRVVVAVRDNDLALATATFFDSYDGPSHDETTMHMSGHWQTVSAFQREALPIGLTIHGPAMIYESTSAYFIENGWTAQVCDSGAIIARNSAVAFSLEAPLQSSVAQRELFTNRLTSIAEEMGHLLQRTALSTNVKQRMDFSCAILDAQGRLVVNAPHIPVHLGSMGLCVREVSKTVDMQRGDVVITNHPAFGGSHLPDITVISPIFSDEETLIGYVANRAHHAELGGTRPGSMPPHARSLVEEGVIISPRHLIRSGRAHFDSIVNVLRSSPWPSRAVEQNMADIRAQVAANIRAVKSISALYSSLGGDPYETLMNDTILHAQQLTADALRSLDDGVYCAEESLDDGALLCVCISITADSGTIDFSGSHAQHEGNLNATPAIVRSAVLYVLRLLIGRPIPLNEGLLEPIDIVLPTGMLNPAFDSDAARSPAVGGGNTETSQRIVDTLLKALGFAACSQGTMNNIVFGDDAFGYYETICGGAGAGPTYDGASAVHTHMTNTAMTDPEILEHRYPVRLHRFEVRNGSGGHGQHRGGDGIVREMEFLQPASLSVLTQHRTTRPYGMAGGEPAAPGRQSIIHVNGTTTQLSSVDGSDVTKGDRLIIETPGGGGYGFPGT